MITRTFAEKKSDMEAYFKNLLAESNSIKHYVTADVSEVPEEALLWKETSKKWSVIEVIDHLNKVYALYFPLFDEALDGLSMRADGAENHPQYTLLGKLSIHAMRPKGDKRRFKMKTFDFFQPIHDIANSHEIITSYLAKKETFNNTLKAADAKCLSGLKMPTSLGKQVKFYVTECFEFILAHEQRHMVQIAGILAKKS